jgi:excinuclease UvrABC nuclease subunit
MTARADLGPEWMEFPLIRRGYYVYLLWGEDETTPLYVGQSISPLSRLSDHLQWFLPHLGGWQHQIRSVSLREVSTCDEMDDLEFELIQQYRPKWNLAVSRSNFRKRRQGGLLVS